MPLQVLALAMRKRIRRQAGSRVAAQPARTERHLVISSTGDIHFYVNPGTCNSVSIRGHFVAEATKRKQAQAREQPYFDANVTCPAGVYAAFPLHRRPTLPSVTHFAANSVGVDPLDLARVALRSAMTTGEPSPCHGLTGTPSVGVVVGCLFAFDHRLCLPRAPCMAETEYASPCGKASRTDCIYIHQGLHGDHAEAERGQVRAVSDGTGGRACCVQAPHMVVLWARASGHDCRAPRLCRRAARRQGLADHLPLLARVRAAVGIALARRNARTVHACLRQPAPLGWAAVR